MANFDRKCIKEPKIFPEYICFDDHVQNELARFADELGLQILDQSLNDPSTLKPEPGTVYVLNEFENNSSLEVIGRAPNTWIIGPTALQELTSSSQLHSRTKPLYCTSMFGLCFHVACPGDLPLKKRMVQLLMWMGGVFVKDPNSKVTHMISSSALARGYIYCSTFNIPILSTRWVEHCWERRHSLGFKGHFAEKYSFTLPMFAGIFITFNGFDSAHHKTMEMLTKENGGKVVSSDDPNCTHMVLSNEAFNSAGKFANAPYFVVNSSWFYSSLQHGHRAYEQMFKCPRAEVQNLSHFENPLIDVEHVVDLSLNTTEENYVYKVKKCDNGFKEGENNEGFNEEDSNYEENNGLNDENIKDNDENNNTPNKPHSKYSAKVSYFSPQISEKLRPTQTAVTDRGPGPLSPEDSMPQTTTSGLDTGNQEADIINSQRKDAKRKFAFEELYQTERNYIKCLKQLIYTYNQAVNLSQPKGPILNQRKAKIIFGNIQKIVEIHKTIEVYLKNISDDWETNKIIGEIYTMLKNEMQTEYAIYSQNVDDSMKMFAECVNENQRFSELIKLTNESRSNAENVKDLFIRPIQRLCSTTLLLQEIKKNTREDNPDKTILEKAISTIRDILTTMNQDKNKVEKLKLIFDIYHKIEDCPPDLITSHREFITQFSARQVLSNNRDGERRVFFLFSDILEITRPRSKYREPVKRGGESPSSLRIKPYTHIKMISLSLISSIQLPQTKEENTQNLFGFTIRDLVHEDKHNYELYNFLDQGCELYNTMLKIAKLLAPRGSKPPEDYISSEGPQVLPSTPCSATKNKTGSCVVKKAREFVTKIIKKPTLRRSSSCSELRQISVQL